MQASLVRDIEQALLTHWDRPCFSNYRAEQITYGQLAVRLKRHHFLFQELGLQKGDRIAVCGRNCIHWAEAFLGALTWGATVVPILSDFHPDQIQHVVNHSGSRLVYIADSIAEKLEVKKMPEIRGMISLEGFGLTHDPDGSLKTAWLEATDQFSRLDDSRRPERYRLPYQKDEHLALIVYTSGTTGMSKGVMLPHRSLRTNLELADRHAPLKTGDCMLSFLPLAHSFGCAFEFLYPFLTGCHLTFLAKIPSPKVLLEAFSAVRPHFILMVPLLLEKIYTSRVKPVLEKQPVKTLWKIPLLRRIVTTRMKQSLSNVFGGRFHEIAIGGAALQPEVEDFLKDIGMPLTIGYGMTECGPIISYSPARLHRKRSAGRVIDGVDVRIDSGSPEQVPGEILVRGPNVMTGYYRNEAATSQALDPDGWLHTGDIGTLDRQGNVFIRGRCKSMLLGPSGQNIYPEEIEAMLDMTRFVLESVVVEREGRLTALIYPDLEAVDSAQMDDVALAAALERMRKDLNRRLPAYMSIARVEIHPELFERTPTKKIKRHLYK